MASEVSRSENRTPRGEQQEVRDLGTVVDRTQISAWDLRMERRKARLERIPGSRWFHAQLLELNLQRVRLLNIYCVKVHIYLMR
jgi:hypothetical protein